jgi:hypothetical protein
MKDFAPRTSVLLVQYNYILRAFEDSEPCVGWSGIFQIPSQKMTSPTRDVDLYLHVQIGPTGYRY